MIAANDVTSGLFVLVGIIASAIGTWLISRRTKSGKIVDSDADKLWDESSSMRRELREQVDALRLEVSALKAEKVEADERWHRRVEALEKRIDDLNDKIRKLESAP